MNIVDVDAVYCGNNHKAEFYAHFNNTLGVVKHFVELVKIVNNGDLLIFIEMRLDVVPVKLSIYNVTERNSTTPTSSSQYSTVVGPAHIQD